ncbi:MULTISPECIES: hypothetical protein [Micrococcaceae]|uniref:Nucleotidyltransferase n=1 Tax=Arthrobacter bambusae TaxID=1338426 RepID=A0ABV2P374_9MICC
MEHVDIRSSAQGTPLVVLRGNREWRIVVEPVRWFERVSWWEQSRRMPRGQGRVDVEVWQVQVRLGNNVRSGIATWELVRDGAGGGWYLRGEEVAAA